MMEKKVEINKRIKTVIKKTFPNKGYISKRERENIWRKVLNFPYLSGTTFEISDPFEIKNNLKVLIDISLIIIIKVIINK